MKNKLAFLALLLAPAFAFGQGKDSTFIRNNPRFLGAFREVVNRPSESTVRILCDGKDTALGMVIEEDGWILTKFNDLRGKITVKLKDGRTFDAKLTGVHKQHDLAMLKIDVTSLTPVELHESKAATAGDWIACVGLGEDPVAFGVVSVGTRNVSFKGPILKGDPSKAGYLGISLDPGEGGVKITTVMPDSAAAKANLKPNDIILSLNGNNFLEPEDFINAMLGYRPGQEVTLKVRRGEEELEIKPTLGKRPPASSRSDMQNKMGSELSSRRTGYPTILQHDSVVKPVDCGGPIVDLDGKVIGINICRAGRVESWAIPAEVIKTHLADLKSGKLAPPALLPSGEAPAEEKKEERKGKGRRPGTSLPHVAPAFQIFPDLVYCGESRIVAGTFRVPLRHAV